MLTENFERRNALMIGLGWRCLIKVARAQEKLIIFTLLVYFVCMEPAPIHRPARPARKAGVQRHSGQEVLAGAIRVIASLRGGSDIYSSGLHESNYFDAHSKPFPYASEP